MTERINTWQSIQQWWENKIVPEEHQTYHTRFPRWYEEVLEAGEAFDNLLEEDTPETRKELGLEIADTFIIGLGLLGALGLDAENLIYEKFERNHIKYNVEENAQLRADGLSWEEAIALQKQRWNGDLTE